MKLASVDLIDHISDHAWPWDWCRARLGGMEITLMSSGIATMIVVAIVLAAILIPIARRARRAEGLPSGSHNLAEVLVVFVRDMIARPALHGKTYEYLPFLLTLFVFILGINLFGVFPVEPVCVALGLPRVGAPSTSIPTVCAGLALLTLGAIVASGLRKQVRAHHRRTGKSMVRCVLLSPWLWFASLGPNVPGAVGRMLLPPLAALELVGVVAKCFSMMVRLCANVLSGHTLLAVLMMFILQVLAGFVRDQTPHLFYVAPLCILGSVAVCLLELLVAGLQAYIFTFLSAMFLGLYVEADH